MASELFEEYTQWEPCTKLELIDGQLIVGKSLTHSRLLLCHILRGWGLEAAIALAPELLWWQALSLVFGAPPVTSLTDLNPSAQRAWAADVQFTPVNPSFLSQWDWKRSETRDALRLAFFQVGRQRPSPGRSIGSTFVNRLGNDALMPDILFFRNDGRNRFYDYYLEGPAEVVVEFLTPGCERHDLEVKRSRYERAGVPELWTIDTAQDTIQFERWVNGSYEPGFADASGCYPLSSVPGLLFWPERLWLAEQQDDRGIWEMFEITPEAVLSDRPRAEAGGLDWAHIPTRFAIELEPVAIAFADYLYWVPESKFEFADGKPWICGKAGVLGLTGMLLMTLGLSEVVRLFHPQQWVEALILTRIQIEQDVQRKAEWWALARRAAEMMRSEYGATRLAVAGDLIKPDSLNFWSELYLVSWDLPGDAQAAHRLYRSLDALSHEPEICHLEGDDRLYFTDQQIIDAGVVEI